MDAKGTHMLRCPPTHWSLNGWLLPHKANLEGALVLCWLPQYELGELRGTVLSQLYNIHCGSHGTKQCHTQPSGTGTPLSVCGPYFLCSHWGMMSKIPPQTGATATGYFALPACLSHAPQPKQRGSTLKTNTELHPELKANTKTLRTHISAVCICEKEHRKSNVNSWGKLGLKCCFNARKKARNPTRGRRTSLLFAPLLAPLIHPQTIYFGVPETQEHKLLHTATSECPWEEPRPRATTWYPQINSSCYF